MESCVNTTMQLRIPMHWRTDGGGGVLNTPPLYVTECAGIIRPCLLLSLVLIIFKNVQVLCILFENEKCHFAHMCSTNLDQLREMVWRDNTVMGKG